ncbi:ABC transporter ATP-binding protein [Paraburkholderia agricolaris]|uniref:ABC transporter ATP-binding protein n=1 Tax=Paraburkholderia agricolaris TaxID=2152888 RepID=UPI001290AF1F|nr:ABC transporter ATP-binding protein [Paraburkholderia agricolaris]
MNYAEAFTRSASATNAGGEEWAVDTHLLNKHFGHWHAVRDVSLQIRRGEIFGFLGPNGSGKTTCMRMLCGLLVPDSGRGRCLGLDIVQDSVALRRKVGYVTQRFSYWGDLSVRENLDFVSRAYGLENRRAVVERTLEEFGLRERAGQLAGALSGGWKQRLAMAASWMHEPELLLLDEPTAGVDPNERRELWEELHRLAELGTTILVSTHYLDEAERCNRIGYLVHGRLLAHGAVNDIVAAQGLSKLALSGASSGRLRAKLHGAPGVERLVAFGGGLYVCGCDYASLDRTLTCLASDEPGLRVEVVPTRLEDVLIYLMDTSEQMSAEFTRPLT